MLTAIHLLCVAALHVACAADLPAAEPPRELTRWFGAQNWEKDTVGPIVSLGRPGEFDDMHIFAPAVAEEGGRFQLWYCGSRGTPGNRVFRLGLASGSNGRQFDKHSENPVLEFGDGSHSILTPALLRNPDGTVLREDGKLRLWFSAATLGKGGLHTLHEATSTDGIHWSEPSPALLENVYCPTVLKTERGYQAWFSDVSRRPWVIRHAASTDGTHWTVTPRPVLQLTQDWEAEVLVYPTVVRIDGTYLMWYGSYMNAIRRETTAIGFAASLDGLRWHKHPQNPVLVPDPKRPWESNYVGSGCVMRLADGSFRYWYASRKQPPFDNLYFAINTARWPGPSAAPPRLRLPPEKGDAGVLASDARTGRSWSVLEVVNEREAIIRAWYPAAAAPGNPNEPDDATFIDLWVRGIDTAGLSANSQAKLSQVFRVTGNILIDTTCGKRSLPLLEPQEIEDEGLRIEN